MKASLDPKVWWLRAQKDLRSAQLNLDYLLQEAIKHLPTIIRFETQISELNTLFMPSHYPFDYADPIGDAEARKSLELAKAIRDLLQSSI